MHLFVIHADRMTLSQDLSQEYNLISVFVLVHLHRQLHSVGCAQVLRFLP